MCIIGDALHSVQCKLLLLCAQLARPVCMVCAKLDYEDGANQTCIDIQYISLITHVHMLCTFSYANLEVTTVSKYTLTVHFQPYSSVIVQ